MVVKPVAPVLHLMVPVQPDTTKSAFSAPQTDVLFDEITGADGVVPLFTTTPSPAALSPQLLLHVAVYVPCTVTEMVEVIAPVFHFTVPTVQVAVSVAASVLHRLVFVAVIVGTDGAGVTLITTAFEFPLSPQLFVHVAV